MNQETYTKIFLAQAGVSISKENCAIHMRDLWVNTRKKTQGGLRLTDKGLEFIKKINLQMYEVPFPPDLDLKAQVIIFLDRFIDCPYHLTTQSITVLSEKKAFELYLFAGDVRKYGLIKAMKRGPFVDPAGPVINQIIKDLS